VSVLGAQRAQADVIEFVSQDFDVEQLTTELFTSAALGDVYRAVVGMADIVVGNGDVTQDSAVAFGLHPHGRHNVLEAAV